jgi:hypothetical protein
VSLKHLTSKLLAGGLTAGIVLIWWPSHYPTTGIEWLVARGILATLGFELMMLAFAGVEDRVVARLAGHSPRVARLLRERAATAPSRARTGFVLAAGGVALVIPVLALASSGGPQVPVAQAATHTPTVQPVRERVVRQVVVKRRVIHDEVVVAAPSTGSASTAQPATSTSTAPASGATRSTPASRAVGRHVASARTTPAASAKPKTTAAPTTTTPEPPTTTTPAAPSASATAPGSASTTVDADAATAAVEPVAP